jgi:23S rRNA (adenine1618-N6)-methyltransferase
MTVPARKPAAVRDLHPRNRHHGRYDLPALAEACPELAGYIRPNPSGEPTIDFADPRAVRLLNAALLKTCYGVTHWDLPDGYLCPPIPGRADYLHYLADLLAEDAGDQSVRSGAVRVLDIGCGANCIYPLLGHAEYGWRFVGSDTDRLALAAAGELLRANPGFARAVVLRHQPDDAAVFANVVKPGERFALTLCNPPFHASAAEARAGNARKWRNLGRADTAAGRLNFGGQSNELWCQGGEEGFIRRMIAESHSLADDCLWFTSLVARSDNLKGIRRALAAAGVAQCRTVAMAQGQKQSRFVAWTWHDAEARRAWWQPVAPDERQP